MSALSGAALFTQKGNSYAAGRPGYAPELSQFLIQQAPPEQYPVAADVGSGTGIFSAELIRLGYQVYGVETTVSMREKAEQALGGNPAFHSVAATAEQSTLPDRSMDLITAASAFHWFDKPKFQLECHRILKPGGQVFVLINARSEEDPFTVAQSEICRRYCPRFESLSHGGKETARDAAGFFTGGYQEKHFPFPLVYTREQFLQRSLSSSYSLNPDETGYRDYERELRELIDAYASEDRLIIANDTILWYGAL